MRTQQHRTQLAHHNADTIVEALAGEFVVTDLPGHARSIFRRLQEGNHIDQVGTRETQNTTVGIYRVEPDIYERAVDHIRARDPICPCGHAGLQNHGDYYQCAYQGCDARFERAEVDA